MPAPFAPTGAIQHHHWHLASEDDTRELARRLARQPDLSHALITLEGDLGAGKTTWVRHLLRALGVEGRIKSPTYAVVEPHELPPSAAWPAGLSVAHCDFYRFDDPREWEDAGLRELLTGPGLKLVEWPQQAAGLLPRPDLALHLEVDHDGSRELRVEAHSPLGERLLQGWCS